MSLLRRLFRDSGVRIVAAVVAYVALALAALAVVVLAALSADQRSELVEVLSGQVPTLVIGAVVALAGLTALLLRGPGAYPRGARRMTGDLQVLLGANPGHRVEPQGPPELVALAGAVNELADRRQAAEGDVAEAVTAARADLERERDLLAALMADLDVAVLVCSPGGRLLLYNSAARALLGDEPALSLGRSAFAIVDRAVVVDALTAIAGGAGSVRVAADLPDGRRTALRISPARDAGFVLVLDDPEHLSGPPVSATARAAVVGTRAAVPPRPESYDFDLFDHDETRAERDAPLSRLAFTVIDLETTGFHREAGDAVVAVGAVHVVGGRLRPHEVFEQLVDPRRPIPAAATAVHGITDEMVRGAPALEQVLVQLARFADGRVLVGHNVGFDLGFLTAYEERAGVRLDAPVLDTLLLDVALHPDHDGHSLEAVAGRLGVDVTGRHTALGDALVTGEVLVRQLALLEARGVRTLGAALDLSRTTYEVRRAEKGSP